MQTNEIWDDYKEFKDESLKKKYYSVASERMDVNIRNKTSMYCTTAEVESRSCSPMLVVRIWSSGHSTKIIRRYSKIIQTMGEMGGNAEILFILGSVVYLWYNKFSIEKHLNKALLNINNIKEAAFYLFPDNVHLETLDQFQTKRTSQSYPEEDKNPNISLKNEKKSRHTEKIFPYSTASKAISNDTSYSSKETLKKAGEVISEFHESKINCITLFKIMDKFTILDKILFKSYHEKLIPLAMLEMTKRNLEQQERQEEFLQSHSQKELTKIPKISINEAYSKLVNDEPEFTFHKMINNFLLESLPPKIKEDYFLNNIKNNYDEEFDNAYTGIQFKHTFKSKNLKNFTFNKKSEGLPINPKKVHHRILKKNHHFPKLESEQLKLKTSKYIIKYPRQEREDTHPDNYDFGITDLPFNKKHKKKKSHLLKQHQKISNKKSKKKKLHHFTNIQNNLDYSQSDSHD